MKEDEVVLPAHKLIGGRMQSHFTRQCRGQEGAALCKMNLCTFYFYSNTGIFYS